MIGHKCYELWADQAKPCEGCPTLTEIRDNLKIVTCYLWLTFI